MAKKEMKGETFKEVCDKGKWCYIAKPKSGKGFGASKSSLVVVREHAPDKWDMVILRPKGASDSKSSDAFKKAGSKLGVGVGGDDSKKTVSDDMSIDAMQRLLSLSEGMIKSGFSMAALTEASGGSKVEGWTEKLNDGSYGASMAIEGSFADILKNCVALVEPKAASGASSFVKSI